MFFDDLPIKNGDSPWQIHLFPSKSMAFSRSGRSSGAASDLAGGAKPRKSRVLGQFHGFFDGILWIYKRILGVYTDL